MRFLTTVFVAGSCVVASACGVEASPVVADVCDLDRGLGALTVDVGDVVSDEEFGVVVDVSTLNDDVRVKGGFTCGAVDEDGHRDVQGDITGVEPDCDADHFVLRAFSLPRSPAFTLNQGGAVRKLALQDIAYEEADDGCGAPRVTSTQVWPSSLDAPDGPLSPR